MAAAVGLGWYPDLRRAAMRMAKPGRRFMPHARVFEAYARRAATYAAIKRYALELADDT
jgi:ribulose kinase